jgi:uncharacterized protein YjiS (DUF1127 family)
MKWKLAVGIVVCVISGLLGLTAGLQLNPQSTMKFVPNWGSLGDWFAAAGTIAAVWVALSQSKKQAEKERPRTKIYQEHKEKTWSVRIVSEGLVPVTVLDASLNYDGSREIGLASWFPKNSALPKKLDRGDALSLIEFSQSNLMRFSRAMVDPVIKALSDLGITPSDGDGGVNEQFFDALAKASSSGAELLIRTAQNDESHQLPDGLVVEMFSIVAEEERSKRLEEVRRYEADRLELRQMLDAALKKPHDPSQQ